MDSSAWAEVAVLIVCVILSALASATETALTSISRLRVRHLAEEAGGSAAILQKLHQDPSRFLSTVLVVNTVALILASSATTLLGIRFLPQSVAGVTIGIWGDLAISIGLAIALLIFAEVTPKSLAIRHAERVALVAAGPVDALATALRPVIWFITLVSRAVTGGRAARTPYLTEQELMTILHVSEEQGVIEEEEREMIQGIVEIGEKLVREVMVPGPDIVAVDKRASFDEIVNMMREKGHTRLPVYEGDLDHVIGWIHAKDLLAFVADGGKDFKVQRILRPISFTPELKKVDELLHEMQLKKVHMMIVVDEYGATSGLVTLEDLIEEIVGEIRDEYDTDEEPLQVISPKTAVVEGRYPMEELNSRLGLGIEDSEQYDSVGGYVHSVLGTIPAAGTTFENGQVRWTVESVNGTRILKVRLDAKQPWPDEVLVEAGLNPPSRDGDVPKEEGKG
jgi:CBS domain containing-hemolysin-like protein